MVGDRWDLQHIGDDELGRTIFGVFVQQIMEDCPGLWPILIEEVFFLLPQPVGAFPTGAQGGVEGDMAEQVERIRLGLVCGRGQFVEVDAALLEQGNDYRALLRVGPPLAYVGG